MLALRIIGTVLVGISCMSCLIKNINVFSDTKKPDVVDNWFVVISTGIGWAWRAFIIVALWLI